MKNDSNQPLSSPFPFYPVYEQSILLCCQDDYVKNILPGTDPEINKTQPKVRV